VRFDPPVPLIAAVTWLPATVRTAERAVAAGEYDADDARRDGYRQLPVSDGLAAPELAALAGSAALAAAGCGPSQVGLLAHAWTHYQGHDFWSPAHFVARRVGADRAVALGVQQMCNGGAAALELAGTRLLADPTITTCLVTTADVFARPGFDRWSSDQGIAYGDGATAVLLGRAPAQLVLRATATVCAPELEAMHRGDRAFGPAPGSHGVPVDVRQTKGAFAAGGGMARFRETARAAVRAVIVRALARAGLDAADQRVRALALPRLGRSVLEAAYLPAVDGLTAAKVLDYGADTGHLGAGDTAANLRQVHEDDLLRPGEVAVLVSAGAGFTWTALVIERTGRMA
jgi:3-oxoacyl-[acyl-carrier-protein] synthase-3